MRQSDLKQCEWGHPKDKNSGKEGRAIRRRRGDAMLLTLMLKEEAVP